MEEAEAMGELQEERIQELHWWLPFLRRDNQAVGIEPRPQILPTTSSLDTVRLLRDERIYDQERAAESARLLLLPLLLL